MLAIDLTGRRAIVTGASSGIGTAVALALAEAGADVAGCGLEAADSEGARRFLAGAAEHGRRAFYQTVDVAEAAAARAFVRWAAEQLGGIDFVISNAGRNLFAGVEKSDEALWEANLNLNLAAHWRVSQAAKPFLDQAEQPVVVIMASIQAYRTRPGVFPYNVAKAALTGLVQSMALEWGPHIRAVGVAPGYIDTPMNAALFAQAPDPAAKRAEAVALHPVGRLGKASEVGALCAFLCSPLAGFISGNTILIDGGRSAVLQDT
jgi:NAD(P)-dependent dehydrogenase (short-subunit alcohol dehydrogenase family)